MESQEATNTCDKFTTVKVSDINSESIDSTPRSEFLIETQNYNLDDGVKVIHQNTSSPSNSFVMEPNLNLGTKKSLKDKIEKEKLNPERPKTARQKMKNAEKKSEVNYSHKLGTLPSYLKKLKQQSASSSKCSSGVIISERPKTIDSALTVTSKNFTKNKNVIRDHPGDTQPSLQKIDKIESEKFKAEINELNEQLKIKNDKIKNLDLKISRIQKEQKQNMENLERIHALEIEIANLKKTQESLNGRLKVKDEVIQGKEKKLSEFSTNFQKEISELNEQLKKKDDEISSLIENIKKLKEENNFLSEQSTNSSTKASIVSLNSEISKLQEQNNNFKKSEEELKLEIRMLKSIIDDERDTNLRHETRMSYRDELIKNLQETDDINKMQIACYLKELEDYRKQLREFEKFKLAHAEEKENFQKLLDDFKEKIVMLKTERDILRKSLDNKTYKYHEKRRQ